MFTGVSALIFIGVIALGFIGFILRNVICSLWAIHDNKDDIKEAVKKTDGISLKCLIRENMPRKYREDRLKERDLKPEDPKQKNTAFNLYNNWNIHTFSPSLNLQLFNSRYNFYPFSFDNDKFRDIAETVYRNVYTDESREYERYIIGVLLSDTRLYGQFVRECEVAEIWQRENKKVYSCNNYLVDFMRDKIHPKVCEMMERDIPFPADFRHKRPGTTSDSGMKYVAVNIGKYYHEEYNPKQEQSDIGTTIGTFLLTALTAALLAGAISSGSILSPLGFLTIISCFGTMFFIFRRQGMTERVIDKVIKQENVPWEVARSMNVFNEHSGYAEDIDMWDFSGTEASKLASDFTREIWVNDWKDKSEFDEKFETFTDDNKKMLKYIINHSYYEFRRTLFPEDCVDRIYEELIQKYSEVKAATRYSCNKSFRQWFAEMRHDMIFDSHYVNDITLGAVYRRRFSYVMDFKNSRKELHEVKPAIDAIKDRVANKDEAKECAKICLDLINKLDDIEGQAIGARKSLGDDS